MLSVDEGQQGANAEVVLLHKATPGRMLETLAFDKPTVHIPSTIVFAPPMTPSFQSLVRADSMST